MTRGAPTLRVQPVRWSADTPDREIPEFNLRHGQAVWVLSQLGFQGTATDSTFYEYIKSLRKLGLPFPRGEPSLDGSRFVIYRYEHLMELALALSLRVYHGLPDAILVELIRHREGLQELYRQAYRQGAAGLGRPVRVKDPTSSFEVKGVFLDLQLIYNGGALTGFGPPRLLSPFEAIRLYATSLPTARALLPMKLSELAENVIATASRAPSPRKVHDAPQPVPTTAAPGRGKADR